MFECHLLAQAGAKQLNTERIFPFGLQAHIKRANERHSQIDSFFMLSAGCGQNSVAPACSLPAVEISIRLACQTSHNTQTNQPTDLLSIFFYKTSVLAFSRQ